MNENKCDKADRKHTIITVLGTAALVLLMLVSIAGAAHSSDAWLKKGIALEIINKHEEAIKAYDKVIEIDPQYFEAWTNKGNALKELGNNDEAIKAYDKAIEINPQDSDAWNNKGFAFDNLNKPDEAIKAFENAIEINSQNSIARYHKGTLSN